MKHKKTKLKYEKAVTLMQRPGTHLIKTHVREGDRLVTEYAIAPGAVITDELARKLISDSRIEEGHDGMWPGASQIWRWKQAA